MPAVSLPIPLTPLLGRTRELREAADLLRRTRLLTLTGAGGSGKTRLAIELARRGERDAAWIDLAAIGDPALVPQQVLGALEINEPPARDVMPAVLDALRESDMLLVFDNCEHLVDRVAAVVEQILGQCASVSVLATTREALGIPGETTWLVPPLEPTEAEQLFAERARAVLPIFAIEPHNAADVARICARLDGMPLAIELAAARVKVLSVHQIAERLSDAFSLLASGSRTLPRHRTLRATIDWSWRLISAEEQVVFRRLAVFAGSFSLDAANAICGTDSQPVLDLLSSLVDKSLVVSERSAGKARYRLLETVRQFASEKLDEAGERDALSERHASFYLALAEEAEPRLFAGASDPAMIEQIDDEIANFRAVFDWRALPAELELRLVYALHWYWFARGRFHEARSRTVHAIGLEGARSGHPYTWAHGLVAAGHAAVWQGDWSALRPGTDEAVDILRGSDDLRAFSSALMLLGTALAFSEGKEAAKPVFDEAVEVARRHGGVALALTLYWSGLAAQLRGELAAARAAFEEAHAIGVAHKNIPATAHPLTVLGWLHLHEERRDDALAAFRQALELHAAVDDRWGLTQVIEGIAFLAPDENVGAKLLAAAEAAWMQLGARPGRAPAFERARDERMQRAMTSEAGRRAVASGAAVSYEEMVAIARSAAGEDAPASQTTRLQVRAFGGVEIAAGKARELLLYLLCNPKGATKEQIGAALWPDADPQKLRNNFHVTLHRLRKQVGDIVAVRDDLYSVYAEVDFDVARFLRDPQRHLDLYRGDFFENGAGEWIEETRARLRDKYASALVALGRERIAASDFAGAAELYQRLIELDELDEQAYRQLLTCYGRLGDPDAATRAYRRLVEALRRELGTEPDPATTRIYERVRTG